jgi:hypothetical protein
LEISFRGYLAFLLKKIIFPDIDKTSLIIISSDLVYLEEISRNNQFVLLENYKYYNNYIAEEGLKLGKMGGITESLQLFSLTQYIRSPAGIERYLLFK